MPVFDRVSEGLQLRILRAACPAHFLLVDPVHAVGVLRFDKQAAGQIARLIFPLRLIPGRKSGKRLETFVLGVELSDRLMAPLHIDRLRARLITFLHDHSHKFGLIQPRLNKHRLAFFDIETHFRQ